MNKEKEELKDYHFTSEELEWLSSLQRTYHLVAQAARECPDCEETAKKATESLRIINSLITKTHALNLLIEGN